MISLSDEVPDAVNGGIHVGIANFGPSVAG